MPTSAEIALASNNAKKAPTMQQELDRLRAENEKLKADKAKQANKALTWKIGQAGGVCLVGMGRYPVTLYYSQWVRVFNTLGVPQDNPFRVFVETAKAEGKLVLKDE